MNENPTTEPFIHHALAAACEHDFKDWRNFDDGSGGEQVCRKCCLGAQAWSMHQADI